MSTATAPTIAAAPASRGMFRSLRVRNYRLFAGGQLVSLTGTWAQRVAQDWLVVELTGGSGTALGITTGLQFLPMLLFGLYGGVLADRLPKRQLLMTAQAMMGVLALALGVLDVTGSVQVWQVYVLAFLLGCTSVIDVPTRQAFVVEMVGPEDLTNAVSLNSATFNAARIVGPAVAGLAIHGVGTSWVFFANAVSYIGVIGGLALMRDDELHLGIRTARARGQLKEGLRYVREREHLLLPIVLVAVIGTFGLNFQLTLALLAKQTFGRGAGAYGLLSAALAVGSLIGALLSTRRRAVRQRLLVGSALAFGVLEVAAGLMPTYLSFALLLVPTGAAVLTFTTAANATVQLGSEAHMRGRVMALYVLVFMGGTPFGAPVIGALAEALGPRSSLLIGGSVSVLATLLIAGRLARRQHLRVEPHWHPRPHVDVRPVAREPVRG